MTGGQPTGAVGNGSAYLLERRTGISLCPAGFFYRRFFLTQIIVMWYQFAPIWIGSEKPVRVEPPVDVGNIPRTAFAAENSTTVSEPRRLKGKPSWRSGLWVSLETALPSLCKGDPTARNIVRDVKGPFYPESALFVFPAVVAGSNS